MYLDEDRKIDFEVPETLKQAIADIDRVFYEKDDLRFALYLDDIESLTKQSYINGNITAAQQNQNRNFYLQLMQIRYRRILKPTWELL